MNIIFWNILIAIIGLVLTPYMAKLVNLYTNEKKITLKEVINEPKFDFKIGLITPIMLIALFFKFGLTIQFFIYAFVGIILIMDAFIDLKAQIIPNGLNFIAFLVGIVLTYIYIVFDFVKGIDMLLRNVCRWWNIPSYSWNCTCFI